MNRCRLFFRIYLIIFVFLFSSSKIFASPVTWDGGGGDSAWGTASNWNPDGVPGTGDDVTIGVSGVVNIATGTTINSLTIGNDATVPAVLNFSYNAVSGVPLSIATDLTVKNGATVTHTAGTTSTVGTVYFLVGGNTTINGRINVDNKGYQIAAGTGAGTNGSYNNGTGGGSYGGRGGNGTNFFESSFAFGGLSYGSLTQPVNIGSGGGSCASATGGVGGGAVRLDTIGSLSIGVSGEISADGQASTWYDPGSGNKCSRGGGSGGSVYLNIGTSISGTGAITANGGNGVTSSAYITNLSIGGAGGGGRIALYYQNYSYAGTVTAYGGSGTSLGGAGTIYKKSTNQSNGDLLIDNNSQSFTNDLYVGSTPLSTHTFDAINIQNYGNLSIGPSTNITYSSLDWATKGIITDLGGTLALVSSGVGLSIPATAIYYADFARTFDNLSIGGTLTHSNNNTSATYQINLTITHDLIVGSSGSIDVSQKGYSPAFGSSTNGDGSDGGGNRGAGGGAGGGNGGGGTGNSGSANGGTSYGSLVTPVSIGSGGGLSGTGSSLAGRGGGSVVLNIGGTLSLSSSGVVTANGGNGNGYVSGSTACYASGAGGAGSIYIITGTLAGTSNITSQGGNGGVANWLSSNYAYGGGGGGGRVTIYYQNSTYSGAVTVNGGTSNGNAGLTGTKLLKATSGELISSPFDADDASSVINKISWGETLPANTDIKFQLRTSPDNNGSPGSWTNWLGPTGAGTYYSDPTGGDNINSSHGDSTSDQWFQYKVTLTAGVGDTAVPTLSSVSIEYVVNSPPTVSISNIPVENSNGQIGVTYTISDPEESNLSVYLFADIGVSATSSLDISSTAPITVNSTANFPASGTVLLNNESISYTSKTATTLIGITRGVDNSRTVAHDSGAAVWLKATSLQGDYGTSIHTGTDKNITWTPRNDIINLENTTAKILVLANDGNAANQINTAQTSALTIDTKVPTDTDIIINSRLNTLALIASDQASIQMKLSNSNVGGSLVADGLNSDSGNYIDFASTKIWQVGTTGTTYAQFRDAYGNESTVVSTTVPAKVTSLLIQDASNPDTSTWRLFTSWSISSALPDVFNYYQVYQSFSSDSGYVPYAQVNNQSENFMLDSNLDNTKTYYYKVTVIDKHGNESPYNTVSQVVTSSAQSGSGLTPNGSGGSDFTAPVISSVVVSNTTSTSAIVSWTTDEISNSTVGFSTDTSYSDEQGTITFTNNHSVTLNNLAPGTRYYFRVISTDGSGNKGIKEDSLIQFFTTSADTTLPVISAVTSSVDQNSAVVTWSTDKDSSSTIEYSLTSTAYTNSVGSTSLVSAHSLSLSGLDANSTYYYRVTSIDANSNSSISPEYIFKTPKTTKTSLTISDINSVTTDSSAGITWSTNRESHSRVEYSQTTGSYTSAVELTASELGHSITINGLTPENTYYYRVTSEDNYGYSSTSPEYIFITTTEPVINMIVSDIKSVVGEKSAGITWATNKSSDSKVEYSLTSGTYSEATQSASMVLGHSLSISGLTSDTTYYYRVKSIDSSSILSTSPEYIFKTLAPDTIVDSIPPTISEVSVSNITASGANISWKTNEDADGKVEYGESTSYERGIAEGNHDFTQTKSISLIGLSPSTTYHYRVSAIDESGNINTSSDSTFTTSLQDLLTSITGSSTSVGINPPAISSDGPSLSDITDQSIKLSWKTNKKSTSEVYYRIKNSTDSPTRGGDATLLISDHTVILSNLIPATTYEYQIKSSDVNGNYVISTQYNFTTSLPEVNGIVITKVTENQAQISWTTKIPTSSSIEYTNSQTQATNLVTDASLTTKHLVDLNNLSPATVYLFSVVIKDEAGNTSRSPQSSFNTKVDQKNAKISGVTIRNTLISGQDKVQTVITWSTNELTTSQVEYDLGSAGSTYAKQTKENLDYVGNHIVVITDLKPSTIYRFRVISKDRGNNITNSEPYVLLTPARQVSALDLILQNLQDIFGWTQKISN